jgi:hypothetical protein
VNSTLGQRIFNWFFGFITVNRWGKPSARRTKETSGSVPVLAPDGQRRVFPSFRCRLTL